MKSQTTMARLANARQQWQPNPSQVVLMAFCGFILVGALLLSMPITHAAAPHSWVDDLFIAASAVCVTGLATIDPGTSYNWLGQLVLMLLIQVGGLGYMTLFTLSMLLVGRRLSMRDRVAMQEAMDQPGMTGIIRFFLKIVRFTLAVEGIGFILLAMHTVPELGWGRGLYMALFHAISAFNNAGFSLFAEGAVHWQHAPGVLLTLSALVIVGGLGYNVNHELVDRFVLRKASRHRWDVLIRLVLTMTAVLLVAGTGLFWWFEHANPRTLGGMPWHDQLANAFFMAVQPRTAGFNSLDIAALDRPTLLLVMVLMFIGAGPGGTAGGIKLTTLAIIVAVILSTARGQDDVPLFGFKRTVNAKQVRRAFTVMVLSLGVVVVSTILLGSIERHAFLPLLFEAISAFSTVGLSMGITGQLTDWGKLILVATMLVGRVGVLVVLMSAITQRRKTSIHYMEESLLIG
ncbi:MAG: TrkH family potassium uptake protein [Candidatus Sericytochromatia bacterium]